MVLFATDSTLSTFKLIEIETTMIAKTTKAFFIKIHLLKVYNKLLYQIYLLPCKNQKGGLKKVYTHQHNAHQ